MLSAGQDFPLPFMFPAEFLPAGLFSSAERECVCLLGQPKARLGCSQPAGEGSPGCTTGRDDSEGLMTLKHSVQIYDTHLECATLKTGPAGE